MRALTLVAAICFAGASHAETCPPAPDIRAPMDALIADMQRVETEQAARPISNRMWALWVTAPDARAQEMLDHGIGRLRVSDYEGAIEAFDALSAYCPDYAESYNQRAFANFLQGRHGEALEDLDLAIERSPRHVGALSGKALTLFGLGRVKAGQQILREALEINPWLSERVYLVEPPGEDL